MYLARVSMTKGAAKLIRSYRIHLPLRKRIAIKLQSELSMVLSLLFFIVILVKKKKKTITLSEPCCIRKNCQYVYELRIH